MKTILIIEDNDTFLDNLTECLKMEGYRVESAANGQLGVAAAKALLPDLIICDNRMPLVTGIEVLAQVKAHPGTRNIPFVFSTAQSEKAEVQKAIEMGAVDYFVKPYPIEHLVERIIALLPPGTGSDKK